MNKKEYNTFHLLKQQGSFLTGVATILNIQGNFFEYNYSKTDKEADAKAMENDWGVIGQDIQKTIKSVSKNNSKTT